MSYGQAAGSETVLTLAILVTPFLAIACLAGGIALARTGLVDRKLGAWLVAIVVPALWPGITMVALAGALVAPQSGGGGRQWISIVLALLPPDALLLSLVGAASLGLYWLATSRRQLSH